jgi:hypothetical protein
MELKENEKQCPICKMNIPKQAIVCPYCKADLSVAGNLGKILSTVGGLLILFVTIPIVLTYCGMCSIIK